MATLSILHLLCPYCFQHDHAHPTSSSHFAWLSGLFSFRLVPWGLCNHPFLRACFPISSMRQREYQFACSFYSGRFSCLLFDSQSFQVLHHWRIGQIEVCHLGWCLLLSMLLQSDLSPAFGNLKPSSAIWESLYFVVAWISGASLLNVFWCSLQFGGIGHTSTINSSYQCTWIWCY